MRIKEFKTIANGLFTAIKKIIEFKFNYKSYLSDKEFSDEKIKKIIDDLTLIFIDYEKEKSEEKETFILETLLGFAFFHNHELFVKLYPHIKKDLKEIFENLFSRELLTVSLKDFSKEETIKNISFINNSTINILCLYYGLKNNNEELVEIIGKIELNDDITKKTAKDVFLDLIVSHGNKIKIESHKTLIKNILNEQPIDNLFKDYHLSKKRIKNINKFFNISLTDEMLKNNIKLDTQNLDDNFVINLLSNDLNSETNFEIIKKLLAYKEDKKLKKNIKRLKNKKLLNDSFFERIFKDFELDYAQSLKSKSTLRNLFNDLEDLSLSFEIKNKAYEKLKEMALDGEFNEVNDYKNFVLNYPNRLSIEELVKILLHKGQSYVGLTDYEINLKNKMNVNYPEYFDEIIHINLKDDFFINTHKENSDFFNNLLKKYPEQMNNMNCFRLFVERSNNDLLVTKYLDYFKEKYGIEKIKEIPFTKINVLNENDIGGLTLNWFIENNLLNKIINDNNSLINFGNHRKNFLVEDLIKNHNISADFFIKQSVYSFISNHQLFKFILNNFEITKQTQQFICNSVVSIDAEDLAKEIVKKGIVPNEYYQEKFKNNLNTSSNILLKGVLKNKLENLENKTTQKEKKVKNMNNSELKNEYYLGSSVFVNLCKQGDLSNLVKFVFEGESPYINHVPSKEKLTRNAIMFFCIGKHQSAIENFFQSPFMQFFDKIDKLEPLKNLISTESNDLIELLIEKLNLSQKDYKSLLFSACDYKSNSVKLMLNKYVNIKELTQEEKLECFLNILKSNTKNDNEIGILKFLEVKFDDFLYHQKDDLLTITAVANKQWDVVNYLMCEKKLRITKHLNALSWSDQTFAEIVRKRKIYDSLTMKMDNKILKEFPKIKKNKI